MNTRWLWSGMLLGSTLLLGGCGSGQYQIPPVEPVVKQKPQDDLLESITGDEKPADTSAPSSTPPPSGGSDEPSGGSGDSAKPAEPAKPAPKK